MKPTDDFLGLMKATRQAAYARMFFIAVTFLFWAALIAYAYFWDVFGLGGWMPHPMNYGRGDGVLTAMFGIVSFFVFSPIPSQERTQTYGKKSQQNLMVMVIQIESYCMDW